MANRTEAEVVKNYLQAVANQKKAYEELDKAKFQVRKFMEEKGAEELIDDTKVLTMVRTWDYDKTKLTPILELIPMEDLVSSGAYTPKETKMVEFEEKWDIRILNRFKKRGSDIVELLERIKLPKSFKLTISDRR
tara:strand:- start:1865 stop:2269 length:405 start_codon:yes stop_codon:yes gene_type:complete